MAEDERGHAEAHHHDHEVAPENRDVDEAGHYELMATAIRDLLVEKGVVTPEQIRTQLEFMDSRGPAVGARIIAKAWTDPAFKERLLDDGTAAVAELGIPMAGTELVAVENTPDVHNVIVCTLCSCYPRTILGLPPDWYKSKSYRSRAVIEPRAVLQEFGRHAERLGIDHPRGRPHRPGARHRLTPTCATSSCRCAPRGTPKAGHAEKLRRHRHPRLHARTGHVGTARTVPDASG